MSIKRGNFVLRCDHPGCDNVINLETDDFEEAKELSQDEIDDGGWTKVYRNGRYADICPQH